MHEMRPEYELSGGVRNRYAEKLRKNGYTIRIHHRDGTVTEKHYAGEKTETLAPDVEVYFPDSKSVNRALRTLISIIPEKRKPSARKSAGGRKSPSRKTLKA
jgi:ketopantoate reductase